MFLKIYIIIQLMKWNQVRIKVSVSPVVSFLFTTNWYLHKPRLEASSSVFEMVSGDVYVYSHLPQEMLALYKTHNHHSLQQQRPLIGAYIHNELEKNRGKISVQPYTFIMHVAISKYFIQIVNMNSFETCMHNKCTGVYGNFIESFVCFRPGNEVLVQYKQTTLNLNRTMCCQDRQVSQECVRQIIYIGLATRTNNKKYLKHEQHCH